MKKSNRVIVEAVYEAFARRHAAAVLFLVSPGIQIAQSAALPWGGHYSGYEGLQKFFAALLGYVDSTVEIERIVDADEHVVVIGRTKGVARATGKRFDVPIAHVWRIQDGRLTA